MVRNGQPANYNNADLGTALNIQRGTVKAASTRPDGGGDPSILDCITFVPDTYHNRCMFLQNSDTEVAEWKGDGWVVISKDWLEVAFADAKGSTLFKEKEAPKAPPQKKKPLGATSEDDGTIRGLADFLKLSQPNQVLALTELVNSEAPEEFKNQLLTDISISQDDALSDKAREFAAQHLEEKNS
jgi:hypothetical protein